MRVWSGLACVRLVGAFAALLLCAGGARAQSGPDLRIATDTVISGDITVDSASTLRIAPGVTIRFEGYGQIRVAGMLIAEGTAERPVRVTSVGRPRGADVRPGWQGLVVDGNAAIVRMRHCRFEGAYTNAFWRGTAQIDSCEFVGNYRGVYCGSGAQVNLRGNRLYRNVYGLVVNRGFPLMLDNHMYENEVGVLLESGSTMVTGRNTIRDNGVNTRAEQTVTATDSTLPVKQLWDIMRRLY